MKLRITLGLEVVGGQITYVVDDAECSESLQRPIWAKVPD